MSPIDKIEANANPRITISTNLTHTHSWNGIRMSSPCGGSWALDIPASCPLGAAMVCTKCREMRVANFPGIHSAYKAEAA